MKYIEKKFNLQLFFLPIVHEHSLFLGLPQATCLLKTSCFEKRTACHCDNAHDIDIFPDEKIMKRSEPSNQAQTKINIVKGLQIYLNNSKNYLTTCQGFKMHLVILEILGKY